MMYESILSKIPPCPGNRLPLSFNLALRFKQEAVKSPTIPNTDSNNPYKIPKNAHAFQFINFAPIAPQSMAANIPPKAPSIDLFGLAPPAATDS